MKRQKMTSYSLCQKKHRINSDSFCGPPGGGGPKIRIVDPPSLWGPQKIGNKYVFLLTQTVTPKESKKYYNYVENVNGIFQLFQPS